MDQIRHIQQLALSILQLEAVVLTAWAALIASKLATVEKGWAIPSAVLYLASVVLLSLVVAQVDDPGPLKRDERELQMRWLFRAGLALFGLAVALTVILATTLLGDR